MIELVSNPDPGARIKVIGAGGCGGNAVNHMIAVGLRNVDFIAVNTDIAGAAEQPRAAAHSDRRELTRGRGTGGNPEIGRKAALEDEERSARDARRKPRWFSSPPGWAAAPAPARRR